MTRWTLCVVMVTTVFSCQVMVKGEWSATRYFLDRVLDIVLHTSNDLEILAQQTDHQCRPLKVTRTVWNDMVKFTMLYKSTIPSDEDVSVTWFDPSNTRTPLTVDENVNQLTTTAYLSLFYTVPSQPNTVEAIFRCANLWYTLHLNKSQGNASLEQIPIFDLRTEPNNDIVYEPGRRASFKAIGSNLTRLNLTGHLRNPNNDSMFQVTQVNATTWPLSVSSTNRGNPMETNFQAATERFETSGLVDLSLQTAKTPNNLLIFMKMSKRLTLGPSRQSAPFPPNYARFDTTGLTLRSDGDWELTCFNEGPVCILKCDVYGSHLKQVRTLQTMENGEVVPTPSIRIPSGNEFARSVSINAEPDSYTRLENNYTCLAEYNNGNDDYFMNVIVDYVVGVNVIENLSSIRLLTQSMVSITCVVDGRPEPEVQFELVYEVDYKVVNPAQIIQLNNHRKMYTAFADVNSRTWYEEDRLVQASCYADRGGKWSDRDNYAVPFPDEYWYSTFWNQKK